MSDNTEPSASQPLPRDDGGRSDVAMLVDFENLKWSLYNRYFVSPSLGSLVNAVSDFGRIVIARAYGDWSDGRLRLDAPNLYGAGIEPVYVPGGVRNSADVRMAVDAVDLAARFPNIGTYVLVTGDHDLIHALHHLRQTGLKVVIVAVGYAMSKLLASAADTVLIYERDVQPLDEGASLAEPESSAGSTVIDATFTFIRSIVESQGREGMNFADIGNRLRIRDGRSVRDKYGVTLAALMARAQAAGMVRLTTVGGVDYAYSVDAPQPELDTSAIADETDERDRTLSESFDVRLDDLSHAEQRTLFRYVKDLQGRSNYMTFKYMLDNMIYHGVLPRLSREQLSLLINHLADRDILVRGSATGIQPGTGISYAFNTFYLDSEHAITQALLNTDDDDGFVQLMTAIAMARATGQLPTKIAVATILGDEGVELAEATAMIDAAVADSVIILARDRDGHEYLRPTE